MKIHKEFKDIIRVICGLEYLTSFSRGQVNIYDEIG